MSAPNPLFGTPQDFSGSHWKELVKNYRPSEANYFSASSGEAALSGIINAPRVLGCLRFLIGYNCTGGATGGKIIQRTNPVIHPVYANLNCHSAAELQFAPPLKNVTYPKGILKIPAPPDFPPPTNFIPAYAGYSKAQVTARFTTFPYEILEDTEVPFGQEYQRNTYLLTNEPRNEFLSLSGFQQTFFEGASTLPISSPAVPGAVPPKNQVPSPLGIPTTKSDVRIIWDLVPDSFVMNSGTKIPGNIVKCLGSVNSDGMGGPAGNDLFFGFPVGTLLLTGVKFTRQYWALALGDEDYVFWRIEFAMSYFDPNKGSFQGVIPTFYACPNNPLGAAGKFTRGWCNAPWRGSTDPLDTNAGLWFGCSYDGTATGNRLLSYQPFYKMWSSPN